MNDFQMTSLATDHRRALLDEARRERLVRTARRTAGRPRHGRRHALALGAGLLIGRVAHL